MCGMDYAQTRPSCMTYMMEELMLGVVPFEQMYWMADVPTLDGMTSQKP